MNRSLFLIAYDVRHPRRLRRVHQVLKDFASGGQKSAFECYLSLVERKELLQRVVQAMDGAAGAAYFEAYQQLFAASLGFNGRNRRPPRDPVNVVLSLSFTLLHAEAVRCLFAVGLDPLLGVYHEPCFGRESLACDLVELFRPLAERWIWRLFADEVLRIEYFTLAEDAQRPCTLGKRGREVFYAEYDVAAQSWRRLMRRTARDWLARLQFAIAEGNNL